MAWRLLTALLAGAALLWAVGLRARPGRIGGDAPAPSLRRSSDGWWAMCAHCKSVRNAAGAWVALEEQLREAQEITTSHTVCPNCQSDHYGHEKGQAPAN